MSHWPSHLLILSLGIACLCGFIGLMLGTLRKTPIATYRILIAAAILVFFAPAFQLAVQGRLAEVPANPEKIAENEHAATDRTPIIESREKPNERVRMNEPDVRAEILSMAAELERDDYSLGLAPVLIAESNKETPSTTNFGSWLALTYLLGALFFLLRSLLKYIRTKRVIARSKNIGNAEVLRIWRIVSSDSPLKDRVQLKVSPSIHSPSCWRGLGKSFVLLPQHGKVLEREDLLVCALRHELIHLERRDSLVAQLQALLASLLWFHPCVWWLSHQISLFRELSCDEQTVQWAGRQRYANALVDFATVLEHALHGRPMNHPLSLLSWSPPKTQLRRRIEMLISNKNPRSRGLHITTMVLTLSAVAFLWTGQAVAAAWWLPPTPTAMAADLQDEEPIELGIAIGEVGPTLASQLEIDQARLLKIESVKSKSIAHRSGLRSGDVIIGVNGSRGATAKVVRAAFEKAKKKGAFTLSVLRRLKKHSIKISVNASETDSNPSLEVRKLIRRAIEAFLDDDVRGSMQLSEHALTLDPVNRQVRRLIELNRQALISRLAENPVEEEIVEEVVEEEEVEPEEIVEEVEPVEVVIEEEELSEEPIEEIVEEVEPPADRTWRRIKEARSSGESRREPVREAHSWSWRKVKLKKALSTIAKTANFSVVVSPEATKVVKRKLISVTLKNTTPINAIRTVLRGTNLGASFDGPNMVRITSRVGGHIIHEQAVEFYDIGDLQKAFGKKNKRMLAQLVQDNVSPEVWTTKGSSVEQKKHTLVVRAPAKTQKMVKNLLGDLRRASPYLGTTVDFPDSKHDPLSGLRILSEHQRARVKEVFRFMLKNNPENSDLQRAIDYVDSLASKNRQGK